MNNPFWQYWYFHIPNYLLAALIYTLFGRFLLSFLLPADSRNYIWRFFCRITDPVVRVVRHVTPRFMTDRLMLLVCAFWLYVLRIVYWLVLNAYGLAPRAAP